MKEQLALQKILRTKYEELKLRNPSYSVRAFARKTGMSPTTLSLLLNGRRKVSAKILEKVSDRLLLDPQERSELIRVFPVPTRKAEDIDQDYLRLTADQYQLVADWLAFAILNLIATKGFKNDPEWISKRLGAPLTRTKETLARLKRLDMLVETADGKLERKTSRYRTTDDVRNLSLRKSHFQNLDLARASLESMDEEGLETRDFTWMTFPLNKRKLALAKTLTRKFQDDLLELLQEGEDGKEPDEVYRLCMQLFPLTRIEKKTEGNPL